MQTVTWPGDRDPAEAANAPREAARIWSIGGLYDAQRILDTAERPLRAKLAVGESIPLWLHTDQPHFGGEPRVRWVSTRPAVATVSRTGGQTAASLRARSPGETEVYAIVAVHGGVRAELSYYCCGACPERALPRCERLPVASVVVVRP